MPLSGSFCRPVTSNAQGVEAQASAFSLISPGEADAHWGLGPTVWVATPWAGRQRILLFIPVSLVPGSQWVMK